MKTNSTVIVAADESNHAGCAGNLSTSIWIGIIGIVGLVGQWITYNIFRKQSSSSTHPIVVATIMNNCFLIIEYMVIHGLSTVFPQTGFLKNYHENIRPTLTRWLYPLENASKYFSMYTALLTTLMFCLAVSKPLKAMWVLSSRRVRWNLLGIALFSLVVNLPTLWLVIVGSDYNSFDKVNCIEMSQFNIDITEHLNLMHMLLSLVIPMVASILLGIANIVILCRKSYKMKNCSYRRNRTRSDIIKILMLILAMIYNSLLIICNSLLLFINTQNTEMIETAIILIMTSVSASGYITIFFTEDNCLRFYKFFFCRNTERDRMRPAVQMHTLPLRSASRPVVDMLAPANTDAPSQSLRASETPNTDTGV